MKLEKKVFRGFLILSAAATCCLAAIYSVSAGRTCMEAEYNWIDRMAYLQAERFADIISQSELAYMSILSEPETLDAIEFLAQNLDKDKNDTNIYFSDSYETIRREMQKYFIYGQCYRIVYFNQCGDVVAMGNLRDWSVDPAVNGKDMPELYEIGVGNMMIKPVHRDEWGKNHSQTVLSVVKRLAGSNQGWFEIQWLEESLDEIFLIENENCHVYFYDKNGNLLYTSRKGEPKKNYYLLVEDEENGCFHGKDSIVGYTVDTQTGITTVMVEDGNIYWKLSREILPILILLLAGFSLMAYFYSRICAAKLVKPVMVLKNVMERTNLDCVGDDSSLSDDLNSSEEIQALYLAFLDVVQRLRNSVGREKHLSMLHLEAQFDLLQAQINPHFIHNVLNVIASKGIMANDESICDMCACLGKMLRYSTDIRNKVGTIFEEKEYLGMYFELLRYRYTRRLEYSIEIEAGLGKYMLPKIVLVQIVENSIRHGYAGQDDIMYIRVTGLFTPNGWEVKVHDNGIGFSEGKISEIKRKMEEMRIRLLEERERMELGIGGMGLVNTYGRLYLTFGEQLHFKMCSDENGTDVGFEIRKP